ncbi:MAG: 50S ribosomal protein L25 [Candidatus Dormibacteria bacterium]
MADLVLLARPRSQRGRHVHAVRRSGDVPAVLYGHNREAISISTSLRALEKIWRQAGRSHLIDLRIEGEKPCRVLIREFQVDPRTARPRHADFFAVNLREKLLVDIPVVTVGEAPAVSELKVGQLQQQLTTIKLECLPRDLPAQISVDVTGLTEVDQSIHVRDLELPEGVTLEQHVDPEELVVKVAALRVTTAEDEAEEDAAAAESAAAAEAAEGATAEEAPEGE